MSNGLIKEIILPKMNILICLSKSLVFGALILDLIFLADYQTHAPLLDVIN